MSCGDVPLHGASETRIEIGLAVGDKTEFQRRTRRDPVRDFESGKIGFGLRVLMRTAGDGGRTFYRYRARAYGFCAVQHKPRFICGKFESNALIHVAHKATPQRRREHHAADGRKIFHQRDVHRELAIAGEKFFRSVERIDQKENFPDDRGRARRHGFFGDDRNVREHFGKTGENKGFGLLVGQCHG